MIESLAANFVVFNEAHRMQETLEHVAPHIDEIVVVDQSSTDGTGDICRDFGAKVLSDRHWGHAERSRQRCRDATESEWILVIDADERMSDEMIRDLRTYDQHPHICFVVGEITGGIEREPGAPMYRVLRKETMWCPDRVHRAPKPTDWMNLGPVYVPPYVAMWNIKSWTELLYDAVRYEAAGCGETPTLARARALDLDGPALDAMTREELVRRGFVRAENLPVRSP